MTQLSTPPLPYAEFAANAALTAMPIIAAIRLGLKLPEILQTPAYDGVRLQTVFGNDQGGATCIVLRRRAGFKQLAGDATFGKEDGFDIVLRSNGNSMAYGVPSEIEAFLLQRNLPAQGRVYPTMTFPLALDLMLRLHEKFKAERCAVRTEDAPLPLSLENTITAYQQAARGFLQNHRNKPIRRLLRKLPVLKRKWHKMWQAGTTVLFDPRFTPKLPNAPVDRSRPSHPSSRTDRSPNRPFPR